MKTAKDQPSSDEKKEDQEHSMNHFETSNRKQPRLSRNFQQTRYLHLHQQETQKPQHTEHYEEGTVMMHNFKTLIVNNVNSHVLLRRKGVQHATT